MLSQELFQEAERQSVICNACRYCEGLCPVFRAIELRREFTEGDITYLAHLCHDCRGCYYACMYIPPHEFAINYPQIMSDVRVETYQQWSWPRGMGRAFNQGWLGAALAAVAFLVVMGIALAFIGPGPLFSKHEGPGSFYEVLPYLAMVIPGMVLFFYWVAVWIRGGIRFWREIHPPLPPQGRIKAVLRALLDASILEWLKGGGPGCYFPGEKPSMARRTWHALVYWGFLFDLLATTLAALYQDGLHWLPPYPLTSAPVVLGTVGGVMMVAGVIGLFLLEVVSDHVPATPTATKLDYVFLLILGVAPLTGLLTLAYRNTSAMGSLLVVHLACVAALFLTAPYGKFVHAVYRGLALVAYHLEQTQHHNKAA